MDDQDRGRELAELAKRVRKLGGAVWCGVHVGDGDAMRDRALRIADEIDALATPASDRGLAAWLDARWSARKVVHNGSLENIGQHGHAGWHVIGEQGDDPDPQVREVYDLHVQYADDGDGGDCSRWLAENVARTLAATPPGPGAEAGSAQLYERLAAIEHERWAHWQSYLHSKCERTVDDDLVIPAGYVVALERQIDTPYDQLTEAEKVSDREQVDRFWRLVAPDTAVRAVLADRGYAGDDEPVADLLARVLDEVGVRPVDPYRSGDGSYPGGEQS